MSRTPQSGAVLSADSQRTLALSLAQLRAARMMRITTAAVNGKIARASSADRFPGYT
jgi:hypothetical protein